MKPTRRENYSVSARSFTSEKDGEPALWDGAYWLELNDAVTISFVPKLPRPPEQLQTPANFDEPADRDEALALLALNAQYVVTPDDERAGGSVRLEPRDDNNEATTVVFFVTGSEFAKAIADLERIHQVTFGYSPASHFRDEFLDTDVIRLVEERVFRSPNLGDYERSVLPVA